MMKYKTAFRLALKVVGVWLVASGLVQSGTLVWWLIELFRGQNIFESYWGVQYFLNLGLYIGLGAYLFFGGEWIVNKAIPSNRPYCHECGYELSGSPPIGTCPECGTDYRRDRPRPANPNM